MTPKERAFIIRSLVENCEFGDQKMCTGQLAADWLQFRLENFSHKKLVEYALSVIVSQLDSKHDLLVGMLTRLKIVLA